MCPKDCCAKLEFVGQLARVSERNLKARETGDITIASNRVFCHTKTRDFEGYRSPHT
jgi:hypothetical protein